MLYNLARRSADLDALMKGPKGIMRRVTNKFVGRHFHAKTNLRGK